MTTRVDHRSGDDRSAAFATARMGALLSFAHLLTRGRAEPEDRLVRGPVKSQTVAAAEAERLVRVCHVDGTVQASAATMT